MLHTTITGAKGSLPIDSIDESSLPAANYYALSHLHIDYADGNFVYSGPIFPNNFEELEELGGGSFYIIELEKSNFKLEKVSIKLKNLEVVDLEIKNALTATEQIKFELGKRDLSNKIVILKLSGKLEQGKISNINFQEIEKFVKSKNAYCFIKSTSKISSEEPTSIEVDNMEDIETAIIKNYASQNPSKFNNLIPNLINSLSLEKQEEEKAGVFEERLFSEIRKILNLN